MLLAAVDSKRAEPYFQLFDAQLVPLAAPVAMTSEGFAAMLDARAVVLVGDTAVQAALAARGIAVTIAAPRHPAAAAIAALGAARDAGEALTPFYLHPAAIQPGAAQPPAAASPAETVP